MSLESFNIHLFKLINSYAGTNAYLDIFMIFSAQFLVFIVPIYMLYLFFNKKTEDRGLAIFLLFSTVLSLAVSMLISSLYYHPRPFAMGIGTVLISHPSDSSFPSDHTTVVFAFSLPFLYFKRYREAIIFIILSALVGFARIFCGVHFPLDIIGGFLVALVISYALFRVKNALFEALFRRTHRIP